MSAQTILLDFNIDPALLQGSGSAKVESDIVSTLEEHFGKGSLTNLLNKTEISSDQSPGQLSVYLGLKGSTISIRIYSNVGLVTVNLDYYKADADGPLLTNEGDSFIKILSMTYNTVELEVELETSFQFDYSDSIGWAPAVQLWQ